MITSPRARQAFDLSREPDRARERYKAERPRSRAVGTQNVLGTLYHDLGIDPEQTLPDFTGRPRRLLDDGEPIAELVGAHGAHRGVG